MKSNIVLVALLALLVVTGCKTDQSALEAQATVSRADAERVAMAQVPGGTIKEAGLEKEKGRLIWSFDISQPGSANIKEVQVDARTGKLVATEIETPADEAKEAQKERKK